MPKKGNNSKNKTAKVKRERTNAEKKLNEEKAAARQTFKNRGVPYKIGLNSKLVRHRRLGQSNDTFFTALASKAAAAAAAENGAAAAAENNAAAAAENGAATAAEVKPKAPKPPKAPRAPRAPKTAAAAAVEAGMAASEAEALATGAAAAAAAEPSGHVAAGKKGVTSAAGIQWTKNWQSARKNIQDELNRRGSTAKFPQKIAMDLATARREAVKSGRPANANSAFQSTINKLTGSNTSTRNNRRPNNTVRRPKEKTD